VLIGGTDGITPGGACTGACNLISGNELVGIQIPSGTDDVQVQGNFIGPDLNGTAAFPGQDTGIEIADSTNTSIGGTTPSARNLISGNDGEGIYLHSDKLACTNNVVQGNFIGTDTTGAKQLGNSGAGVLIMDGADNGIGGGAPGSGNLIRFNGDTGVVVIESAGKEAKRNVIRSNEIADNAGLGIDLAGNGPTANDAGDGDAGANELQNRPVITSVVAAGTSLTINGTLNSTPNATFAIDLFASEAPHPASEGTGRFFLGSNSVSTNASGHATFSVIRTAPDAGTVNVSATATDVTGNTSEFCATKGP
jgi:titin